MCLKSVTVFVYLQLWMKFHEIWRNWFTFVREAIDYRIQFVCDFAPRRVCHDGAHSSATPTSRATCIECVFSQVQSPNTAGRQTLTDRQTDRQSDHPPAPNIIM